MGLQFTLSGGTDQQRRWFQDAVTHATYPNDANPNFELEAEVTWVPEPDCPGHADYMCARLDAGVATIQIRDNADDATIYQHPGPLQDFYAESVVHEIGHLITFYRIDTSLTPEADRSLLCGLFRHKDGQRQGTAADWNPLEAPWGDRVQEAAAEFFKDVFLPDEYRVYDNRSNWRLPQSNFGAWWDLMKTVLCYEPPANQ